MSFSLSNQQSYLHFYKFLYILAEEATEKVVFWGIVFLESPIKRKKSVKILKNTWIIYTWKISKILVQQQKGNGFVKMNFSGISVQGFSHLGWTSGGTHFGQNDQKLIENYKINSFGAKQQEEDMGGGGGGVDFSPVPPSPPH